LSSKTFPMFPRVNVLPIATVQVGENCSSACSAVELHLP
ncbi:hypothetical protein NPIL_356631, partial [Nephila pilipes]